MTLHEFIDEWSGKIQPSFKGTDDYGMPVAGISGQCVNNIRWYTDQVLKHKQISGRLSACDFAVRLPEWCVWIDNTATYIPKAGDIAVWSEGIGRHGHIAVVISADLMSFKSFDANWNGQECKVVEHSYQNVIGFIRSASYEENMELTA